MWESKTAVGCLSYAPWPRDQTCNLRIKPMPFRFMTLNQLSHTGQGPVVLTHPFYGNFLQETEWMKTIWIQAGKSLGLSNLQSPTTRGDWPWSRPWGPNKMRRLIVIQESCPSRSISHCETYRCSINVPWRTTIDAFLRAWSPSWLTQTPGQPAVHHSFRKLYTLCPGGVRSPARHHNHEWIQHLFPSLLPHLLAHSFF